MLASQSSVKGISDRKKYQKAMMLKGSIEQIRKDYTKNLSHSDDYLRQIACAMWLIDVLALRVGGEKSEEEADTELPSYAPFAAGRQDDSGRLLATSSSAARSDQYQDP